MAFSQLPTTLGNGVRGNIGTETGNVQKWGCRWCALAMAPWFERALSVRAARSLAVPFSSPRAKLQGPQTRRMRDSCLNTSFSCYLRCHLFSKTSTWAWMIRHKICPLLGLTDMTQGLCRDPLPSGMAAGGWVEDAETSEEILV